jgi:hypothetical protein
MPNSSYSNWELSALEDKFERLFKLFDEKTPVKHPVFQAAKIARRNG